MACAGKSYGYFVIYTYKDIYVEKVDFDPNYFETVLLPKLKSFYVTYWRPFLVSKIVKAEDPAAFFKMWQHVSCSSD